MGIAATSSLGAVPAGAGVELTVEVPRAAPVPCLGAVREANRPAGTKAEEVTVDGALVVAVVVVARAVVLVLAVLALVLQPPRVLVLMRVELQV